MIFDDQTYFPLKYKEYLSNKILFFNWRNNTKVFTLLTNPSIHNIKYLRSRFPYAAVAELAFGSPAKKLVTFLIDAAIFGSGVPNLIIGELI